MVSEKSNGTEEKTTSKTFTKDVVKNHSNKDDVWFIIHGKVYDVTKYIGDHPGGSEIMEENAGKDVSDQFEEFFHSADAREVLKKHEVGVLEGSTEEDWKKLDESGGSTGSTEGGIPGYLLPLLVVFLAILYQLNKMYNFV
mmetsp:Transcript_26602/g.49696  ORF Transcript_26602/g.49696 Transcript_26602/m.49696 type:complete len:141 (-) Transcript_26602:94-516(-)|eukprot:CAMPEP_0170177710 /NCGR_PEP_ID=MMETSP0040_2-20121228/10886_1 /TAXON_ID=641309 /ORGANISM="Lotharella oceanica, Strain CCMP622" /LENGTH=140 /DNA_ID=CAMNT_0010420465 /DNA_START=59 /DNA_END=481 /DNA_ORIENTATION=+